MKSLQKPRNKKKVMLLAAAILLALLAAGGLYVWLAKPFANKVETSQDLPPVNTVNYGPPTEKEKKAGDQAKQDIVNPPQAPTLSVTISRASQADAGKALNVRTIVTGASSGTCTMTFTQGSNTFSKTFPIIVSGTAFSCNGDIAASDFSGSGSWSLRIIASSDNSSSEPATQQVSIAK